MIIKKNNRELSKAFDVIDTTWKKWSREFLPPDPLSGKGRGRTREYTPEQAFVVYLGGIMVSEKAMTFRETREALDVICDFMKKKGLFTIKEAFQNIMSNSSETWEIMITRTPGGSNYTVESVIEETVLDDVETESGLTAQKYNKRYYVLPLKENSPTGSPICTVHLPLDSLIKDFVVFSGF